MTPGTVDASVPAVVLKLYHGGLAVTRTLGRLGVDVHGVAPEGNRPANVSRYLRAIHRFDLDTASPADAAAWLCDLGARIGNRPLLVPTEDVGAAVVAEHADDLSGMFRFPEQPRGLVAQLSSKEGMRDLCEAHGVPTPFATVPTSRLELDGFLERVEPPYVLKAIDTSRMQRTGGANVRIVHDAGDARSFWDETTLAAGAPNLLLQEYIPGDATSVWMFNGYFDGSSDCRLGITGQKLRQYPPHTGFTSLGICRENGAVREVTATFMKALGYRGVLDIGYRYDARDGLYKLLDVNPRVGSTFRLFVTRQGLDVVRALYLDLTGQSFEGGDAAPGRKWVIENLDLVSSIAYAREGSLGLRQWARSYAGVKEAAWFARDDLRPFLAMAADGLRRAARSV